jgi:hypothetical protein
MGCGDSKVGVVEDEVELSVNTGRFNSYLALLPPLFSEYKYEKNDYLISGHVSPDYKSMVFACVDANANYYEKVVQEEELIRTVCELITICIYTVLIIIFFRGID